MSVFDEIRKIVRENKASTGTVLKYRSDNGEKEKVRFGQSSDELTVEALVEAARNGGISGKGTKEMGQSEGEQSYILLGEQAAKVVQLLTGPVVGETE